MNKKDIVAELSSRVEGTHAEASRFLEAMLEVIKDALVKGEDVDLYGFGKFEVRARAARQGRNPQTGASISIPAKNVPAFKASKALKEAV